jgi:hypothetical protein
MRERIFLNSVEDKLNKSRGWKPKGHSWTMEASHMTILALLLLAALRGANGNTGTGCGGCFGKIYTRKRKNSTAQLKMIRFNWFKKIWKPWLSI